MLTHLTNSMRTIHTRAVTMWHTIHSCADEGERAAAWLPFALATLLCEPESAEAAHHCAESTTCPCLRLGPPIFWGESSFRTRTGNYYSRTVSTWEEDQFFYAWQCVLS